MPGGEEDCVLKQIGTIVEIVQHEQNQESTVGKNQANWVVVEYRNGSKEYNYTRLKKPKNI